MKSKIIKGTVILCTMTISVPFLTACGTNTSNAEQATDLYYENTENTEYSEIVSGDENAEDERQANAFVAGESTVNVVPDYLSPGAYVNNENNHQDRKHNDRDDKKETRNDTEASRSNEEEEYEDEQEQEQEENDSGSSYSNSIVGYWIPEGEDEDTYLCFESGGGYYFVYDGEMGSDESVGTYKVLPNNEVAFTSGYKTWTYRYDLYADTLVLSDVDGDDSHSYTRM